MTIPEALREVSWRLTEVPAIDADMESITDAARGRMLPTIGVAHASGRRSVCCWARVRPGGRTIVMLGGGVAPKVGPRIGLEAPIDFPAGSRGVALPHDAAEKAFGQFGGFTRLELSMETLAAGERVLPGPQLEDLFGLLPEQPMAVALVASPAGRDVVQPILDELSDTVDRLQPRADGRGSGRLELERALDELRYLELCSGWGLWDVEVWVGAPSPAGSRAVAGMLAGSADLRPLPLRVRYPESHWPSETAAAWTKTKVVGPDVVASLMRGPVRELPGIRVVAPMRFDLNPETKGDVRLGNVLDASRQPCLAFSLPLPSINRHMFVTGATGSGKSETIRTLLERLATKNIPWLVIEPAKAEYARMGAQLQKLGRSLTIIRPGAVNAPPPSLNPLEPSSILLENPRRRIYFRVQTHLDLVRALFTASFQADEPFPQILGRALTMSYEEHGWNLALARSTEGDTSIRPQFPTLADVQRCAQVAVDAVEYGAEVRNNVRGFVDVRLGSLRLGTPGRFFEDGHPLDLERLLESNVVFEIEDLGDDNDKAFFIGCILIRLFEVLRLYEQHGKGADGLRHVMVLEEAHRLLRNVPLESASAHAVTMFANLLAEVRAYGEGIVVAEQIPAKIMSDVVKNSAVKVVHRLPSEDDRQFVGATMNLTDEQSTSVVGFLPGQAAAHVDGMDGPVMVQVDSSTQPGECQRMPGATPPMKLRSTGCPERCRTSPCRLEDLVISADLANQPRLVLWVEIVTLAHLMGEPAGELADPLRSLLLTRNADQVRCAIALLATAAVHRRSRWIRWWYSPSSLEGAVAEAMARQLTKGEDLGRPDATWQIGRFRWNDVRRILDAEPEGVKQSKDEYRYDIEWRRRGLSLPKGSWFEVRTAVRTATAEIDSPFDQAFFGRPPVLAGAAAALSREETPWDRVDGALNGVLQLPTRWPSFHLYPVVSRSEPKGVEHAC